MEIQFALIADRKLVDRDGYEALSASCFVAGVDLKIDIEQIPDDTGYLYDKWKHTFQFRLAYYGEATSLATAYQAGRQGLSELAAAMHIVADYIASVAVPSVDRNLSSGEIPPQENDTAL